MAIDVLKRQGKSAVTGILGKNLRRISGNIGSVIRGEVGGDSSDFAGINRSKQATKMLSFPIDVGADPGIGNHGHYIMFFINEQKGTKLGFGGGYASSANAQDMGLENIVAESHKRAIKGTQKIFDGKASSFLDQYIPDAISKNFIDGLTDVAGGFGLGTKSRIKTEVKHNISPASSKDSTVFVKRPETKRLDTVISMYMPASVKTSYTAEYDDKSISSLSSGATEMAEKILDGQALTGTDKENIKSTLGEVAEEASLGMLDMAGGGLREAIEMKRGVIISDRMELAFKGVKKREFTYDFKMMPRSKAEADEIANIIYAFKFNMLPEFVGSDAKDAFKGKRMRVPNTFDIQYMYVNQENKYLHKISTCYLSDMQVTYGGSKYKTFDGNADGAPPVETAIALTFKEIELITKERIEDGF